MRVEASVIVAAPRDRVWSSLVAWEGQPRWMSDVGAVRVVGERRQGAGVRLAVPTRVLGVTLFTDVLEVTSWQPPGLLVVEHRRVVRGEGTWILEHLAGERTRFTWVEDVRGPIPILGELALHVYRPVLRRMMRGSLDRFRLLVETNA